MPRGGGCGGGTISGSFPQIEQHIGRQRGAPLSSHRHTSGTTLPIMPQDTWVFWKELSFQNLGTCDPVKQVKRERAKNME